jgi:hypothetical protein
MWKILRVSYTGDVIRGQVEKCAGHVKPTRTSTFLKIVFGDALRSVVFAVCSYSHRVLDVTHLTVPTPRWPTRGDKTKNQSRDKDSIPNGK